MRRPRRLRGAVTGATARIDPLLLPGALAFAVFVILAALDAGYAATTWYGAGLFLLAILGVVLVARPPGRLPLPGLVALALLGAFTAWSFLSIAWADVAGVALDGANRTLVYLVVYALFLVLPWRAGTAAILLGGYAVAIATLGAAALGRAAAAASPEAFFLLGRFAEPAEYQNASCALFLTAFWPALCLASRRDVPPLARAPLLAAAGVLLELALLTQSRASIVAFPATLAVYFLVVPGRVRSLLTLVPVAAAVAVASPTLLEVFEAFRSRDDPAGAVDAAASALAVTAGVLLAVGLALALADRRVDLRPAVARRVSRGVGGVALAALAVAAVVAVAAVGNPVARTGDAWDEFRADDRPRTATSYFAQGFGSNRYDVYRVAWAEFRRAPVVGTGADNFAAAYVRHRRSDEEPQYPHSLELRLLSQTGVVGTLLFAAFVVAATAAAAARLRRVDGTARAVGAVALVVFAYWAIHGSVDWFWELAGLGGPAFAALALAAAVERPAREPHGRRRLSSAVLPAAAVAAAVLLVPPWLAAKEVDQAAQEWGVDNESAFARLDRARALNPLADDPDVVGGAIASRLGDFQRMRQHFRRAVERNDRNWYSWLELGVAEALTDRPEEALRSLARARALNPRDEVIASVAADVRAGRAIRPAEIDRTFLRRLFVDTSEGREGVG